LNIEACLPARNSCTVNCPVIDPSSFLPGSGQQRTSTHITTHACCCRVGPGNFTLSPSQIRTGYSRIIRLVPSREGCRLPLNEGFFPANRLAQSSSRRTGWPKSAAMTRPLRSTAITAASLLLRGSPPLSSASVFRPRGWGSLRLFPWHRRQGSHIPYPSLIELLAAYTPDAARAVSGHLPSLSRRKGHPAVLTSPNPLSTLQKQFACARLVWGFSCQGLSWAVLIFFHCQFLCSIRRAVSSPDPLNPNAGARRSCQGWPSLQPCSKLNPLQATP
jgi:hypothetical protein